MPQDESIKLAQIAFEAYFAECLPKWEKTTIVSQAAWARAADAVLAASDHAAIIEENQRLREENAAPKEARENQAGRDCATNVPASTLTRIEQFASAAMSAIIMRGTASDPLTAGQVAKKAVCVALAMGDELDNAMGARAGEAEAAKQC